METADNKTDHILSNSTDHTNGVNFVTTSTFVWDGFGDKILKNVVVKDEVIEIIYLREATVQFTTTNGTLPESPFGKAIKEIYGVRDGKLTLLDVLEGKYTPAHHVEESFEFEE